MKRGDVYWVRFEPRSGSEQQGKRPAVVVTNDGFNATPTWRSIVVVPVTTSEHQRARGPSAVALAQGSGGLEQDSLAICHQITTVDRGKFGLRLGTLTPAEMTAVEDGIKAALDME